MKRRLAVPRVGTRISLTSGSGILIALTNGLPFHSKRPHSIGKMALLRFSEEDDHAPKLANHVLSLLIHGLKDVSNDQEEITHVTNDVNLRLPARRRVSAEEPYCEGIPQLHQPTSALEHLDTP
jgi:hypothetical protein